MLVLVTGATGRIGHQLTRALVRAGHTVRAFAGADHPRAGLIAGPQVEFAAGRLEDVEAVNAAVRGVDAIYHLAAGLGSRGHTEEQIVDFNVRGTFNMLRAARDHAPGLRQFLYASSDAVYWSAAGLDASYLPIAEAHQRLAGSIYGAAKLGAEEMCWCFMRAWGIPATVLRFGATANIEEVITPHSRFSIWLYLGDAIRSLAGASAPAPEQAESLDVLRRLDDGREQLVIFANPAGEPEVRQWADARDIAAGCVCALGNPAAIGETFNLGGFAPWTTAELIQYMAPRLNLPYVTACMPITRRPWYISSAKARGLLGYTPRHSIFDMVDEAIQNRRNP